MTVLSVSDVGKVFWDYKRGIHRLMGALGFVAPPEKHRWVFRNLSFTLEKGETLGIIGRNGEGKSTLLKIIAGVMKPSEGYVSYHGRVSAILELGMGFNPDYTARQNALHVLSMMGLSYEESKKLIPEIQSFADIGDFFDEPVRVFSSGMAMRVAFGISISVVPDIMIIDEALSVGDIYFQQKCLEKLKELTQQGTALLIVSHDPNTLRTFCSRACLLEKGNFFIGNTAEILEYYESLSLGTAQTQLKTGADAANAPSDQENLESELPAIDDGTVRTCSIRFENDKGLSASSFRYGQDVILRVDFELEKMPKKPVIGILIKDRLGRDIFSADTAQFFHTELNVVGGHVSLAVRFKNLLVEGLYFVSLSLADTFVAHNVFAEHHYFCHRVGHFYSYRKEEDPFFCGVCQVQMEICA